MVRCGWRTSSIRVPQPLRDVGPAAELDGEQHVHRLAHRSDRSTTSVSNSTSDVFTAGSSAKIDAITAEKIALSSIDPELIDDHDHVPRLLLPLGRVVVRPIDQQLARAYVEVLEVAAQRGLEVEGCGTPCAASAGPCGRPR
jgi:hypothetical protein